MRLKRLLIIPLAISLLACSLSGQAMIANTPVPNATETVGKTSTPVSSLSATLPDRTEKCVSSVGLWLRKSPEISDNKLFALPQETKVVVIQSGEWSRVYVRTGDMYGYVKSSYLGNCK